MAFIRGGVYFKICVSGPFFHSQGAGKGPTSDFCLGSLRANTTILRYCESVTLDNKRRHILTEI